MFCFALYGMNEIISVLFTSPNYLGKNININKTVVQIQMNLYIYVSFIFKSFSNNWALL